MIEKKYRDFALEAEDPVVVFRGPSWEQVGWGPCQFPSLSRTLNGQILCAWSVGEDTIEGYEGQHGEGGPLPSDAVSEDGGRSWRRTTPEDGIRGVPCGNGKEYLGPAAKNARPAAWTSEIAPIYRTPNGYMSVFRASDIPGYSPCFTAREIDPATGKTDEFVSRANWPNRTVRVFRHRDRDLVYPLESEMGIMGRAIPDGEGGMYFATYGNGVSAASGEFSMPDKYNVYVFHSGDCGRNWDWISEVLTTPDLVPADKPDAEGLCEPGFARMPDSSHVMLLRMGSGCPSWIVRSTDGCRTWSKPARFDSCGVLPQLCVLGCGVSLAGYGRPGVFLRASADPAGLSWEDPVDLGIRREGAFDASCCYTAILPLDDCSALFAYSDFRNPAPDGSLAKAILVRRVTVKR